MADKRITVLVYGADRDIWLGSSPRVIVADLNRTPIRTLVNQRMTAAAIELTLKDLALDSAQIYCVGLEAKGHRSAWQILQHQTFMQQQGGRVVERPDVILRMMLVPRNATSSDLPGGYDRLVAAGSALPQFWTPDMTAYRSLPVPNQMAVLNLAQKLEETTIEHASLMSYVRGVRAIDPDRLFLMVDSALPALVQSSPDFASAQGHDAPTDHPDFPAHQNSWKHQLFPTGNIQLSFATTLEPWPRGQNTTLACSLDVDIDLSRGVDHGWEFLENLITGDKTDQRQVYQLLFGQGILPLYTLDEASSPQLVASRARSRHRRRPS